MNGDEGHLDPITRAHGIAEQVAPVDEALIAKMQVQPKAIIRA
ncbi:hypothetical protein [Luteibacter aegosomaticola]|nr:hypothetical protein [Luteibacter aegosomaticola]